MALSSLTFIFVFLPVLLILFYVLPYSNWRNSILVIASLVFFGWADLAHLPLMIFLIIFNYFFGLIIWMWLDKGDRKAARPFMWLAIIANLMPLLFYKYTGFALQTLNNIANISIDYESKALPLGISFFTFSALSYILDVYHSAEKAERNFIRFSSYLIMFPKLLQGPITRFKQVKSELEKPRFQPEEMLQGARRFISGLAKKILLADSLGKLSDKIFGSDYTLIGADLAWMALIAYTLQIYLDFAGYTDMAIGLGKMLGFKLPENFNYPYVSRSITEFWRRWHMTLTSWFRNYVFIPLEFARKREKFLRQQSNILIVFMLTGLWHGANWNFVLWGIYFGIILAIESGGFGKWLKKIPIFLQHFYSLALIMLGWVFFRITDITSWRPFLDSLLGGNGWSAQASLRSLNVLFYAPLVFIGIIFCIPILSRLEEKIAQKGWAGRLVVDIIYIALFILSISSILAKGFNAFLYAQF